MKIDKYIKDVSDRLDNISNNGNSNYDDSSSRLQKYYDEYYLDIKSEPPRFAYYRHVRVEQCTDEYRKKSLECVLDSITQDELDYYLKRKLRTPPEERYQERRRERFFHESSSYHRGLEAYDGYGCYNGQCIPECRYYLPYGRIEDHEIITEHKEAEEYYRRQNAIIDIDINTQTYP